MTGETTPLDSAWIAAHPAPVHQRGTTKNSRGRVLVIGGSRMVPGALRLTGEAALRVGAGKLQMATIASAALPLGLWVPEAATIALPENDDGEIGDDAGDTLAKALGECDALVVGPGIGDPDVATKLLRGIAPHLGQETVVVVDAMAIGCLKAVPNLFAGPLILTPHHGEMAILTDMDAETIAADPAAHARKAARDYRATVALKGSDTVIATADGALLHYGGGGTGLATGGSGDVLAGAITGLLSRGADPLVAAGWGVWLHGQAGRRVATTSGPIGFLARELPPEFPRLLPQ